eukprot:GHVN01055175.1.p1 GENE.GHVN01055175.1~~GHVN01055175.1.p1  ORF type:complete len:582 (+),score=52.81 GHVN01055175.1:1377-3122(+)
MTNQRMNQFYKTKICPWYFKGRCERGSACRFAHSNEELKVLPNLTKTSYCPQLTKTGKCMQPDCRYAHSSLELRATDDMYKTALCFMWMRGSCQGGELCRHAHGLEELREPPTSRHDSEEGLPHVPKLMSSFEPPGLHSNTEEKRSLDKFSFPMPAELLQKIVPQSALGGQHMVSPVSTSTVASPVGPQQISRGEIRNQSPPAELGNKQHGHSHKDNHHPLENVNAATGLEKLMRKSSSGELSFQATTPSVSSTATTEQLAAMLLSVLQAANWDLPDQATRTHESGLGNLEELTAGAANTTIFRVPPQNCSSRFEHGSAQTDGKQTWGNPSRREWCESSPAKFDLRFAGKEGLDWTEFIPEKQPLRKPSFRQWSNENLNIANDAQHEMFHSPLSRLSPSTFLSATSPDSQVQGPSPRLTSADFRKHVEQIIPPPSSKVFEAGGAKQTSESKAHVLRKEMEKSSCPGGAVPLSRSSQWRRHANPWRGFSDEGSPHPFHPEPVLDDHSSFSPWTRSYEGELPRGHYFQGPPRWFSQGNQQPPQPPFDIPPPRGSSKKPAPRFPRNSWETAPGGANQPRGRIVW